MADLICCSKGNLEDRIQKTGSLLIAQEVQISLFQYPYALLKPSIQTDYVALASIEDIAAMKMIAVAQRGTRRDFIDLYFLAKRLSLRELLRLPNKNLSRLIRANGLRSLIYFQDAEQEGLREGVRLLSTVSGKKLKGFFQRVVAGKRLSGGKFLQALPLVCGPMIFQSFIFRSIDGL